VNLSLIVLILSLVFAVLALVPWGANPARPWTPYFYPLSWFCFVLYFVLMRGAINLHG
jgi:hypothetical protein